MNDPVKVPDKATRDSWTLFEQIVRYNTEFKSPAIATHGFQALNLGKGLIVEEVINELLPALDKYMSFPSLENLNEVTDGIIDGVIVLLFLAHQFGLPFDQMWKKVQDTQWAKVWPDGTVHRQGPDDIAPNKIIKPDGWVAPDFIDDLIEWNSKRLGQTYAGGLIRDQPKPPQPKEIPGESNAKTDT